MRRNDRITYHGQGGILREITHHDFAVVSLDDKPGQAQSVKLEDCAPADTEAEIMRAEIAHLETENFRLLERVGELEATLIDLTRSPLQLVRANLPADPYVWPVGVEVENGEGARRAYVQIQIVVPAFAPTEQPASDPEWPDAAEIPAADCAPRDAP